MAIARVEPLVTARALRGPFDYLMPERLGEIGVGSVLLVPFGPRRLPGVVVEIAESSELPFERLAEPVRALGAGVPPELVRLGLWTAREYCSTPARGLELVTPPGTGRGDRQVAARRELRVTRTAAGETAVADGGGGARLGARQRQALAALGTGMELPASGLDGIERQTLRRLERRGLVKLREVEVPRRPAEIAVGAPAHRVALNRDQARAVDEIVSRLGEASAGGISAGDGERRELLLHGITGSGKTEVYLAAAEAALQRGRGVIALVPEIGLTPQTVSRFRSRFGERVALLHSRLSAGERHDEWERLRHGRARVAIGPRSAVFAPVAELGLIVIDEEHDASYKQESDPRYDARDVAARRAADAGAVLVAGSATPRPESWMRLPTMELAARAGGGPLPPVEVLDMRERPGRAGPLHARALEALGELARDPGKAIVLVNRRGWSPFLSCRSCGAGRECPRCEVSLVLHRLGPGRDDRSSALRCHHCGHGEPLPPHCPECGSVTLAQHGAGSERIAAVIAETVGSAEGGPPVFRLDADTAARPGAHAEILRRFEQARSGVLVGTQMVAKGHDFPDVVLSVVVDADATLRFPDFRAEERTFALVAQLAGRSGRGPRGGRVLVQTLAPEAEAIRRAARHDTAGFLAGELERRRALGYPPYAHLVRVGLSSSDEALVERTASRLAEAIDAGLDGARLLGPAPRFRLRDRHRRQLLVKSSRRAPAVAAVRDAVEDEARARRLRGVAVAVDVDPQ